MVDWPDGYIAVEWGATNRRAYLLDGNGRSLDDMEDDIGVMSVGSGGFGEAVVFLASYAAVGTLFSMPIENMKVAIAGLPTRDRQSALQTDGGKFGSL